MVPAMQLCSCLLLSPCLRPSPCLRFLLPCPHSWSSPPRPPAETFKRNGIELVLNSRVKAVSSDAVTVVDKADQVRHLLGWIRTAWGCS